MSREPSRSSQELLDDIVQWGERIPTLVHGMTFDEFSRDYRSHLAVWKCIEVVGEASGRLLRSQLSIDAATARKLRLAYEMRNRLTHGYPGIDLHVLWTTARISVPELVDATRALQRAGGDEH